MNATLIKTLSVVSFALLLVIALEWFYATYTQKQLLNPPGSSPVAQTVADEMPAIDLNSQPEESYANLVKRPLFIKDRKPVAEAEPAQIQAAGMTNTFDWQLNGIYTSKKGLMALLTRTIVKTPGDKYRKVIVGDSIDGWKLAEIHPDKIMLTQGNNQKDVLLRKPKVKTQAQNSAIPINSPTEPAVMPEPTNDSSENDNNAPNQ